jgi:DNA-binding beta-propeller fold protein YncE
MDTPRMSSRWARMAAAAALASMLTAGSASAATPSAFVYATSWSQAVSQYSADDGGLLSALTPPDVGTGLTSTAAASSPDRRSLYVVNQTSGNVSQFDIGVDGALTPKTPDSVVTGRSPVALAVAPDGQHVYVVNQGDRTIGAYDVDGAGALTFASSVASGPGPVQIAVSPDGSSAYVTNFSGSSVAQFDVAAAGALTPKDPATVPAGSQPAGIAVSPDGASVYVTNQATTGTVRQFSVDPASGGLTPKAQPTVAAGTQPRGIVATAGRVYVANIGSNTISQYAAGGGGALTQLAPPVRTPRNPFGLALSPDDSSLYAAAFADAVVGQYDVAADGTLAVKAAPAQANFRPQAVVAVAPRDEQAPTVDLRAPQQGAQYDVGADVRADYSCADEGGSGLQSCAGDVSDGDPLDTSALGAHNFTVVARDGAGRETTVAHSYTVVERLLGFRGFLGPIHDGSVVRAGDAIPIVFSLGADRGLHILADGSPTSVQVDCEHPGEPTGGEPADSQSDRGLRFNRWTGQYVFVWQTKRAWAGTCRSFVLGLRDGSVGRLTVSFRSARRWHRHH